MRVPPIVVVTPQGHLLYISYGEVVPPGCRFVRVPSPAEQALAARILAAKEVTEEDAAQMRLLLEAGGNANDAAELGRRIVEECKRERMAMVRQAILAEITMRDQARRGRRVVSRGTGRERAAA